MQCPRTPITTDSEEQPVNQGVKKGLLPVLGFAIILAAWWVAAAADILGPGQLPRPDRVIAAIVSGFIEGGIWRDVMLSVLRVVLGVAIGAVLAIPIGFALAWYPSLRAMFAPMVNFFRALPPIALIPLVIVYLGISEDARVSILVYAAFFSAVVVITEGVSAIDDIYVRAARAMGASQLELFWRVVIPLTIPQVLVGVRVALGVSWATVVAAELVAAQSGLGAMIQNAANFFQMDLIYGGIILIGACALFMDLLLGLLMKRAVKWQERRDS